MVFTRVTWLAFLVGCSALACAGSKPPPPSEPSPLSNEIRIVGWDDPAGVYEAFGKSAVPAAQQCAEATMSRGLKTDGAISLVLTYDRTGKTVAVGTQPSPGFDPQFENCLAASFRAIEIAPPRDQFGTLIWPTRFSSGRSGPPPTANPGATYQVKDVSLMYFGTEGDPEQQGFLSLTNTHNVGFRTNTIIVLVRMSVVDRYQPEGSLNVTVRAGGWVLTDQSFPIAAFPTTPTDIVVPVLFYPHSHLCDSLTVDATWKGATGQSSKTTEVPISCAE
jgi:hypothetical protein